MMKNLMILLFLFSVTTSADDYKLNIHLTSHHFKERPLGEWNKNNIGVGIEKHFDGFYLSGGFLKNSYSKTSTYLSLGKNYRYGEFTVGGLVGVASGYPDQFSTVLGLRPVAGIRLGYKHLDFTFTNKVILLTLNLPFPP